MLKRAAAENLLQIRELCKGSILGTKILCFISAYGLERDFLEVWVMLDGDVITAVMTKFYDDIALLLTDGTDTEQLSAFLGMFSYKTLTCNAEAYERLGLSADVVKNGYIYAGELSDLTCDSLEEDDYRGAYNLISREIPDSFSNDKEAYLSFLSDFTFRKRRGLARGVCTHTDGRFSSVALTSSETEDSAIISGVACDRSLQKRGLGKTTVLSLVNSLKSENKAVFVIALNSSAEGFYEHIGFIKTEQIAFVERKNYV